MLHEPRFWVLALAIAAVFGEGVSLMFTGHRRLGLLFTVAGLAGFACLYLFWPEVPPSSGGHSIATQGGGTGGKYAGGGAGGAGAPGGSGGTYIQNQYNYGSPLPSSTPTTPTFQGLPVKVFILGFAMIPMGQPMKEILAGKRSALITSTTGWGGQPKAPVLLHLKNRRFYVDAQLWDEPGRQKAVVSDNVCLLLEPHWDCNFNDTALEIVDEERRPVFQMIYTVSGPANLVVNGVFPYPPVTFVGSDTFGYTEIRPDQSGHRSIPWNYTKRIFKYPSWQYHGQYDELGTRNSN